MLICYFLHIHYRLPKNVRKRLAWEKVIKEYIHDYESCKVILICSDHFNDNSFYKIGSKVLLHDNGVPEVFTMEVKLVHHKIIKICML